MSRALPSSRRYTGREAKVATQMGGILFAVTTSGTRMTVPPRCANDCTIWLRAVTPTVHGGPDNMLEAATQRMQSMSATVIMDRNCTSALVEATDGTTSIICMDGANVDMPSAFLSRAMHVHDRPLQVPSTLQADTSMRRFAFCWMVQLESLME